MTFDLDAAISSLDFDTVDPTYSASSFHQPILIPSKVEDLEAASVVGDIEAV